MLIWMQSNPPHPADLWQLLPGSDLRWRCWGVEFLVYQPASMDTHLLNPFAAEALLYISRHHATIAQTAEHVASLLELQADAELHRKMEQCFERFHEVGLIEPVHAAARPIHA